MTATEYVVDVLGGRRVFRARTTPLVGALAACGEHLAASVTVWLGPDLHLLDGV